MKIKGRVISGPREELVVFPRTEEDLVFKLQAVLEYDDFEKMCVEPEPPTLLHRDGTKIKDINDSKYKAKLEEYGQARTHWTFLKSISATPDLEWETVDMSNPTTWGNYRKELTSAGLSIAEITLLFRAMLNANSLDEDKLEEARKRFLASQAIVGEQQ
jgi:hypothetical protein